MTSSSPPTPHWRDIWFLALLAPALVVGCYSSSFNGFDDSAHWQHELMQRSLPLSAVLSPSENSTYFPVTVISYRADRFVHEELYSLVWPEAGPAPFVRFHSLLYHLLAAIFLWRTLLHLRFGRWMSLFAASAWLAHPAACESVCWISERKNVLAALFGFASLWTWFRPNLSGTRRILFTAAFFTLAMLSKPNAAGFVPIYVFYEVLLARKDEQTANRPNRFACAAFFFASLLLIAVLAKINVSKTTAANSTLAGGSYLSVILTDIPVMVQYIYNSLIPASLSIFYYNPIITSPLESIFLINLLILALVVSVTIYISSNRPRTLFLWIWFIGALGPALNVVPIPYLSQDRYAYFSLPAVLLIAAESICALIKRMLPNYSPDLPRLATLSFPIILAIISAMRSYVYQNDFELFRDAVQKQPQSAYARQFYGIANAEIADKLEFALSANPEQLRVLRTSALEQLEDCLKCPDSDRLLEPGRVRILIGVLNEQLGNLTTAMPQLMDELKKQQKPYNRVIAFLSLARIQLSANKPDLALTFVDDAILSSIDQKGSPEMFYLKGICLEKLGRIDEAKKIYLSIPVKSFTHQRAQARLSALNQ